MRRSDPLRPRARRVHASVYALAVVSFAVVVAINGFQIAASGGPSLSRLALVAWAGTALAVAERARRTGLLAVVRGR